MELFSIWETQALTLVLLRLLSGTTRMIAFTRIMKRTFGSFSSSHGPTCRERA